MRTWAATVALLIASGWVQAQETPVQRPWASSIGAGVAMTSGNTNTRNTNFSFTTKYDPKERLLFKAEALFLRGSANGETQVDKATANARAELTISDRTFAFTEVSYLRDPFKEIDYSIAPLAGGGYRLLMGDIRSLTVDAAAGMQIEREDGVGRSTSGAVKAGENFEWKLSEATRVTQRLSAIWQTDDFGDALYHFDAGLVTTLVSRLELKIAWNYDYKAKPASAGVKKGDSAFFAALLFKF